MIFILAKNKIKSSFSEQVRNQAFFPLNALDWHISKQTLILIFIHILEMFRLF